ncbi:hypothetical protein [Actinotalea sp.]|uniref:hypothetical protein n=1 Tax=Actinotalea sp. TaxID=1872145 RepID=UPI003567DC95
MSADRLLALNARDDLLWIADRWTQLRARLRPGGGGALNGMPRGGSPGAPIDLHVSDLMAEIEWKVARHYGNILLDETPPQHGCSGACHGSPQHQHQEGCDGEHVDADACPTPKLPITTSQMPRLLAEVARRYGHFTEDERLALDFCDDASDYRERVRKVLERPAPPVYVGPCRHMGEDGTGCVGELYVKPGKDGGSCKECGTTFTLLEQREWLEEQFDDRLMTAGEIASALVVLDVPVPMGTIKSWIARRRLMEAVPGDRLYRLADARELARERRGA